MSENALYLNKVPLYYTDRKFGLVPKEMITEYFKSDRFKAQQSVIPVPLIPRDYLVEIMRNPNAVLGGLTIDSKRALGHISRVYVEDDIAYVDLLLHNEEIFDAIDGGEIVVTPSLLVIDGANRTPSIQSAFAYEAIPNPERN